MIMEAEDGTIVEVFEWKSKQAIDAAHTNPRVLEMWEEYAAVCDYVPGVDHQRGHAAVLGVHAPQSISVDAAVVRHVTGLVPVLRSGRAACCEDVVGAIAQLRHLEKQCAGHEDSFNRRVGSAGFTGQPNG